MLTWGWTVWKLLCIVGKVHKRGWRAAVPYHGTLTRALAVRLIHPLAVEAFPINGAAWTKGTAIATGVKYSGE